VDKEAVTVTAKMGQLTAYSASPQKNSASVINSSSILLLHIIEEGEQHAW